jgi:hypothetical protein
MKTWYIEYMDKATGRTKNTSVTAETASTAVAMFESDNAASVVQYQTRAIVWVAGVNDFPTREEADAYGKENDLPVFAGVTR